MRRRIPRRLDQLALGQSAAFHIGGWEKLELQVSELGEPPECIGSDVIDIDKSAAEYVNGVRLMLWYIAL